MMKIKFKIGFFLFMQLLFSELHCQESLSKSIFDVNNDAVKDTIIHNLESNVLTFNFENRGINSTQEIYFFKNYAKNIANISVRKEGKSIVFQLTFAPQYLDTETLNFEYDISKKNWMLKTVTTHYFNPINPDEKSEKCVYKLKEIVYLEGGLYDSVQEKISENSNYFFKSKKCQSVFSK